GLHLDVLVGAAARDGTEVGAARLALAHRDALDRVSGARAPEDLHVEAFLAIPALLEGREVRRVLAVGQEVEDEREGADGLRLGLSQAHHGHEGNDHSGHPRHHGDSSPAARDLARGRTLARFGWRRRPRSPHVPGLPSWATASRYTHRPWTASACASA